MARWIIVPAFMTVIALATTLSTPAAAQDMPMNSTTVMVPSGSGSDMMSVTVKMPMGMMMPMSDGSMMMMPQEQPRVRQIPGVGYEIDFGGPSVIIERSSTN